MPNTGRGALPGDSVQAGLEVDYDFHGRPVLLEKTAGVRSCWSGLHFPPRARHDVERLADEYGGLEKLMPSGCMCSPSVPDLPPQRKVETPTSLYEPMVDVERAWGGG